MCGGQGDRPGEFIDEVAPGFGVGTQEGLKSPGPPLERSSLLSASDPPLMQMSVGISRHLEPRRPPPPIQQATRRDAAFSGTTQIRSSAGDPPRELNETGRARLYFRPITASTYPDGGRSHKSIVRRKASGFRVRPEGGEAGIERTMLASSCPHRLRLLVAKTIYRVGPETLPTSTTIFIKMAASRARQLHQLRGRVGRYSIGMRTVAGSRTGPSRPKRSTGSRPIEGRFTSSAPAPRSPPRFWRSVPPLGRGEHPWVFCEQSAKSRAMGLRAYCAFASVRRVPRSHQQPARPMSRLHRSSCPGVRLPKDDGRPTHEGRAYRGGGRIPELRAARPISAPGAIDRLRAVSRSRGELVPRPNCGCWRSAGAARSGSTSEDEYAV